MNNLIHRHSYVLLLILIVKLQSVVVHKKEVVYKNKTNQLTFQYRVINPISLNNVHDIVINNKEIKNASEDCIKLIDCYNVTIENCRLLSSAGDGVHIYNCKNVKVVNCYIENVASGIYALDSENINVSYNQVKNVQGPFPKGQMVQFNNVSGNRNIVGFNRCENIPGQSNPEDVINMFKTNGTKESPVEIVGNWIRGGGPSKTGGGIMLGDNGGSYLVAERNTLVNPGQYGIAIAGGTNNKIIDNKIYSKKQIFTNVGLYVWNQHNSACALNTVRGNLINWTSADGETRCDWDNGNCGAVTGWEDNMLNANIDSSILPHIIISDELIKTK